MRLQLFVRVMYAPRIDVDVVIEEAFDKENDVDRNFIVPDEFLEPHG